MKCPVCGGRIMAHWQDGRIELRCYTCIARASEMRERIGIEAIVVKAVQEVLDAMDNEAEGGEVCPVEQAEFAQLEAASDEVLRLTDEEDAKFEKRAY